MTRRTYHDPLHRGISLDPSNQSEELVIKLIDTEPFQRLRRIRQLGPAFLTFHGAESSRFTHSLGVFHIARMALDSLIQVNKSLGKERGVLYGAALLHDLGHGPLSHTSEEMYGLNHERWSAKLIREYSPIKEILESYEIGTSEKVADILEKKQNSSRPINSLISSQLDCDRLDYLMRDSYSTGTQYGQLDLERILSALTIAPDEGIAINPKGLMAVEHYLIVRNLMYRSVYNHKVNEVCNWLLQKIILTAREMGPKYIWADSIISKWLWDASEMTNETFLANDDLRTGYHLLRWKEEGPKELSMLCKRFINRHLLKGINISNLKQTQQLEALALARKLAEREGQNPDLCCGLSQRNLRGYTPYKSGLRLWDGINLKALEQVSPLVASLTTKEGSSLLIHPKEIHQELKNRITELDISSRFI